MGFSEVSEKVSLPFGETSKPSRIKRLGGLSSDQSVNRISIKKYDHSQFYKGDSRESPLKKEPTRVDSYPTFSPSISGKQCFRLVGRSLLRNLNLPDDRESLTPFFKKGKNKLNMLLRAYYILHGHFSKEQWKRFSRSAKLALQLDKWARTHSPNPRFKSQYFGKWEHFREPGKLVRAYKRSLSSFTMSLFRETPIIAGIPMFPALLFSATEGTFDFGPPSLMRVIVAS
jgi:hypothetical protein